MVPGPFAGDKGPALTREGQCDSRLLERQKRLDIGSRSLCTAEQALGSALNGPVCHLIYNSAGTFLQLERRHRGSGNRCLLTELGRKYQLCPLTIWCLIVRVLTKIQLEKTVLVVITPLWRSQPWFPVILDMLVHYLLLMPVGVSVIELSPNCDCPLGLHNQLQLVT